jgi:lipoyl(octanoyl) transferase
MTTRPFNALDVYHDDASHSAAMNMAIDEALLEAAIVPSIRFYQWQSPALSFGYFGKFADVTKYAIDRDLVRRWTGGGIVFHGDDLTYSIVIPASDPVSGATSMSTYAAIHVALRDALIANGQPAELAPIAALYERPQRRKGNFQIAPAVADRRYSHCFANPVEADVMVNGRKIAGAAQRRTRTGLLQQGSIQRIDRTKALAVQFVKELSCNCKMRDLPAVIHHRAQKISARKYGTETWLRKR